MKRYKCTNPNHPAFGKYFTIRRIEGDHLLAEWCTWTYICTWLWENDISTNAKKMLHSI